MKKLLIFMILLCGCSNNSNHDVLRKERVVNSFSRPFLISKAHHQFIYLYVCEAEYSLIEEGDYIYGTWRNKYGDVVK